MTAHKPGGGAASPTELLGPFAVTYQTTNINNPADNGALIGPTLTAGTLVLAVWVDTTTPWTAATSVDECIIVLDTGAWLLLDIAGAVLNDNVYQLIGSTPNPPLPAWVHSGTERIAIAVYSTGALTAGAGNVYALTVSV